MRLAYSAFPLLDADPDLAAGLQPPELREALRCLLVPVTRLEPGLPEGIQTLVDRDTDAMLLVLEGLLLCELTLAGGPWSELIGPGDVLGSRKLDRQDTFLPVGVTLSVVEPTYIAVLGRRFQLAAARRWPQVTLALLERVEQRTARLAKQTAICRLSAVKSRLLALFLHLADRWGRVGHEHVVIVPLHLLHRTLGRLVGAERSTVTLALKELADAGLVQRRADGAWLLQGDLLEELRRMNQRQSRLAASRIPDSSDPEQFVPPALRTRRRQLV